MKRPATQAPPAVPQKIFAYGFRNPFSFSFDMTTGLLYLGDVGQNKIEETDVVNSGGNYGWRIKEGSFFFNPNGAGDGFVTDETVVDSVPPDLVDPIAEYGHGVAVIGGYHPCPGEGTEDGFCPGIS